MPSIPEGAQVISAPSVIVNTSTTTVNTGTMGIGGGQQVSTEAAQSAAPMTQDQLASELFKTMQHIDIARNVFGTAEDSQEMIDLFTKEKGLRTDILSTNGGADRIKQIDAAFEADQKL